MVQAALQAAAAPYGLRFGPDPSTHNRCTIGGMIGNNACGPRALGYGKTADNVVALKVVTGAGERVHFGPDGDGDGLGGRRTAALSWWPPTWVRSGPSSAASVARCRATACSTCCPRTGSTLPGSWPGLKAPLPW